MLVHASVGACVCVCVCLVVGGALGHPWQCLGWQCLGHRQNSVPSHKKSAQHQHHCAGKKYKRRVDVSAHLQAHTL
eukprot:SAG11_NODE_447_length_9395_cov_4.121665_9_plen_76_part_00